MNDMAQQNLTEPAQVDWANYGKSGYQPPPPALDANGKPIVYQGKAVVSQDEEPDTFGDDGGVYLQFKLDPLTIIGPTNAGYEIKFTRASVRPYTVLGADGKRVPKKGNPNKLADYLKAAGATAKPQLNSEYIAAVNLVKSKPFSFVVDWEARNSDTGEKIKGYNAFPDDPQRPGQKKSILKAGDLINVLDSKGNPTGQVTPVKSEVLFANARLRFFRDVKAAGSIG